MKHPDVSHEYRPASRARRLGLGLLAALILYGNAAVILQPRKLGLQGVIPGLPLPFVVHDAFVMTGMFNSYATRNVDFFIEGELAECPAGEPRWIALDRYAHFPYRHGVTFTQMGAVRHWDMHGPAAQRWAWKRLAHKIRARHNRRNPERRIRRVRFGTVSWPMSPDGYRLKKTPGAIRRHVWFTEPPP